jgi:hypothetical protein
LKVVKPSATNLPAIRGKVASNPVQACQIRENPGVRSINLGYAASVSYTHSGYMNLFSCHQASLRRQVCADFHLFFLAIRQNGKRNGLWSQKVRVTFSAGPNYIVFEDI